MDTDLPQPRATLMRPTLLVVAGVVILTATAGIVLYQRAPSPEPAPPAQTASLSTPASAPTGGTASTTAPASAPAEAAVPKPSFDVVRINPQGDAVMAGRAAPGSKVIISDAGKTIGEALADQNGDWVFVPSSRLPAGSRELTLAEQMPNGTETKGDRSVVLVVPPASSAAGQAGQAAGQVPGTRAGPLPALAVLTGPNVAPRVLTGPGAAPGAANAPLALGAMEYDEQGEVRFAGTAPPGTAVRVYIDNQPIGGSVADQDGRWSIAARDALAPGEHRVRLDQIGTDGKATARLERPFTRQEMAAVHLPAGQIQIARGQNLWTIARTTYGQGIRYLVIFQANRTQIRDPNLIYPGQVFALPTASEAPAMPASSSTSR